MARARVKVPEPLRELQQRAEDAGWIVVLTNGHHIKWLPPDKTKPIVHTSLTPGGGNRSIQNCVSLLKRSGLQ